MNMGTARAPATCVVVCVARVVRNAPTALLTGRRTRRLPHHQMRPGPRILRDLSMQRCECQVDDHLLATVHAGHACLKRVSALEYGDRSTSRFGHVAVA